MAIIEWEDRFLTHVPTIDEHHQHLVSLINITYDDFVKYAPHDHLCNLFHELFDYATYHFHEEERLMEEYSYPELEIHRDEHNRFTRRVVEMHSNHLQRQKPLFLETLCFLQTWLLSHILQTDAAMGTFLAPKVCDTVKKMR